MSEEALQIAEKRREGTGNGERKRYTQLNAEFQRIARTDKTALNEQCEDIEENNRMGKTRDLFKKTEDVKGTFLSRVGIIQDKNDKGLKEAEEIKKRGQEYTVNMHNIRMLTVSIFSLGIVSGDLCYLYTFLKCEHILLL